MSLAAVGLVLLSAALHVAWNLRSRHDRPTAAYFALSLLASMLLLAPVLWVERERLPALLGATWPALLGTAFFSTTYNVALAGAYRRADLSFVYPLARSVAPVFVAAVGVALGRGELIGLGVWVGIPAIVLGAAMLPLGRLSDLRPAVYLNRAFVLPLITAASTAGYTLCDDFGVRGTAAATDVGPLHASLVYAAVHAVVTALSLTGVVLVTRRGREELRDAYRQRLGPVVFVGVASYASYLCVLAAMGLVSEVSYVSAFRQAGIPLSVLAGALVLHERVGWWRTFGAALCTAGLLAVALG